MPKLPTQSEKAFAGARVKSGLRRSTITSSLEAGAINIVSLDQLHYRLRLSVKDICRLLKMYGLFLKDHPWSEIGVDTKQMKRQPTDCYQAY